MMDDYDYIKGEAREAKEETKGFLRRHAKKIVLGLFYAAAVGLVLTILFSSKTAQADEHFRPGQLRPSIAFCKLTDENLTAMRRIHREWDVPGYEALVRDPTSTCFDQTVNGFPLPDAEFVSYVMEPIKTNNGRCIQYVLLTVPQLNNVKVFSWVPSQKCLVGQSS